MSKLNILLIGLGSMGSIHKRIIEHTENVNLYGVVDSKFEKKFEKKNGINYFKTINSIDFASENIDGAIIASSTDTHFKFADLLFNENIPILVEKPIVTKPDELDFLVKNAIKHNKIFRSGLIEIYNPIFNYIKDLNLNDIISIQIFRHSQPISGKRKLENVLYDLALHDISVINYIFSNPKINLLGHSSLPKNGKIESSELLLNFNDTSLFISSSRESQIKIREWNIQTRSKLFKIDLIAQKIDIYEAGSIKSLDANIFNTKSNHTTVSFANKPETAQIQFDYFIKNIYENKVDKDHLNLAKKSHNLVSDILKNK